MLYLRKIYNDYLAFEKSCFLRDSNEWMGVGKADKRVKESFYNNYYKNSFFHFLTNFKNILCLDSVFDFVKYGWGDEWELGVLIDFLKTQNIVNVKGVKIIVKDQKFWNLVPRIQSEGEIISSVEKKIKRKLDLDATVTSLFGGKFRPREDWDQMPISQSSAIFFVGKIIKYLPLNKTFLFIGDDDFLSVFLGLANPKIESLVVDADEDLLARIDEIARQFKLKIKTKKIDTRKDKRLGEEFIGFSCNPPYTEGGVKNFVSFGSNQLGKDGGNIFLAMGDESIGNRIIFLQKFFAKKNFLIRELEFGKIFYPYSDLNREEGTFKKLRRYFSEEVIENNPRLSADLWIFNYIPFKVKRIRSGKSIYSYL